VCALLPKPMAGVHPRLWVLSASVYATPWTWPLRRRTWTRMGSDWGARTRGGNDGNKRQMKYRSMCCSECSTSKSTVIAGHQGF
jgi:hypothetical protein